MKIAVKIASSRCSVRQCEFYFGGFATRFSAQQKKPNILAHHG